MPSSARYCVLRVALLLMALQAVGAVWMVEQPISSLAWYHPRLRRILRTFTKVWVQSVERTFLIEFYPFNFLGEKTNRIVHEYSLEVFCLCQWFGAEPTGIGWVNKYILCPSKSPKTDKVYLVYWIAFITLGMEACGNQKPFQVYVCRWWMGHYKSYTPKRHICWANSKKIGALDRGCLTKDQREEIRRTGVKSAKVKTNKKGKKSFSGTSSLRATG